MNTPVTADSQILKNDTADIRSRSGRPRTMGDILFKPNPPLPGPVPQTISP